jgi:arylsulfatase A-like enzyme
MKRRSSKTKTINAGQLRSKKKPIYIGRLLGLGGLVLVGILLVIFLPRRSWGQNQRNSVSKPPSSSTPASMNTAASRPAALPKAVKPTAASAAVNKIRKARGTNIIICVLDAARPDHMGCYGYPRPTTPTIDRLAKESLVFDRHFCQYPVTELSTGALFESKYVFKIQPESTSLVEWLQQLGFNTMLYSGNIKTSFAAPMGKGFNRVFPTARRMGQWQGRMTGPQEKNWDQAWSRKMGLDRLGRMPIGGGGPRSDRFNKPEELLTQVNDWLATKPTQRFFAYLHFVPPHLPYDPPQKMLALFKGKKPPNYWHARSAMLPAGAENGDTPLLLAGGESSAQDTINLYDANLRYADWAVEQVVQSLKKAGVYDNTLLIITADHGESLGEHNYGWHPGCPYDEALRIPLILHFPGKGGPRGRVKALTQTVDLLPTVLDIHNLHCPGTAKGRSLLPLLAGEKAAINSYSFSGAGQARLCDTYVVRDLQTTLMLSDDGKTRALYDDVKDPRQTKNIIKSESARAAKLVEAFRRFALAQPEPPLYFIDPTKKWKSNPDSVGPKPEAMSEEVRRQLKTLGYIK